MPLAPGRINYDHRSIGARCSGVEFENERDQVFIFITYIWDATIEEGVT